MTIILCIIIAIMLLIIILQWRKIKSPRVDIDDKKADILLTISKLQRQVEELRG